MHIERNKKIPRPLRERVGLGVKYLYPKYKKQSRGCHGFDVVIGISGLRVRELFSVINGQIKLNANDNVVRVDFGARALAA